MKAPDFWYPAPPARTGVAATLLTPLGWLYDGAGRFKARVTKAFDPGVPVICVGNLTVGGTGKTPVALTLARFLQAEGARPWFLTRGHGGREAGPLQVDPARHTAIDVGDEPLLLARTAPTAVSRNRAEGAGFAAARGADVIVMDDGFQNPGVAKTVNLVVVDGTALFGNGRVVPAGPLREAVAHGLARAHGVIVMGPGRPDEALAPFAGPVFRGRLEAERDAVTDLQAHRHVAFAGIGRPTKFFATARALGLTLVADIPFADHHPYTPEDFARLRAEADRLGAGLLTTEKDAARLSPTQRAALRVLPVRATFDNEPALRRLISDRLDAYRTLQGDRPARSVGS
ncbi:MAG: tetraacyldisaccharide 4'-kinase [Alphaproteobacteria bacterium]